MRKKAKIRSDTNIIRVVSNMKCNLINLKKALRLLYNMESKLNKRVNGIGTCYYELTINKKDEVKKAIVNNLLHKMN